MKTRIFFIVFLLFISCNKSIEKSNTKILGKTGQTLRKDGALVSWVQLWENGPRFADYNIGSDGKYWCGERFLWGGHTPQDSYGKISDYNVQDVVLNGNDDTATRLWGNNWRMPDANEISDLFRYCTFEWVEEPLNGYIFKGKDDYNGLEIFFPASSLGGGTYWTRTPCDETEFENINANNVPNYKTYQMARAYQLRFDKYHQYVQWQFRNEPCFVRAVIK